ncbi:MAG TPA: DUF805 domain-containing protein [Caulobacteraceae bacterium]|jgi:uncharacterized membrane protein YhaH (DUF805 family)
MSLIQMLFGFHGRLRRLHYWLAAFGSSFALSTALIITFSVLSAVLGFSQGRTAQPVVISVLCLLALVYLVLMFWIGLALQVKRWHDRDKSGVWVLIGFVPLVGPLWSLIECGFLDGTEGPNQFGPSPKGITGPPPVRI